MTPEVIAHRGAPVGVPENSLAAFEHAIGEGADGIEFDVRLSADGEPFVFHNFELDEMTSGSRALVAHTAAELRGLHLISRDTEVHRIPSLQQVLDLAAGKTILEIELKGLELQIVGVIAAALIPYRRHWTQMEITSFEPTLLKAMSQECSIAVDVLMHRSESWMKPNYVGYSAVQRARLAGARAVHLQVDQLTVEVVEAIRREGFAVHVHGVDAHADLTTALQFEIGRFDTDHLGDVLQWLGQSAHERAV